MPYSSQVDSLRELATIVVSGDLTAQDMQHAMSMTLSNANWHAGYSVLWDLRQVRSFDVDDKEIEQIAAAYDDLASVLGSGYSAFIVSRDQHFMFPYLIYSKRLKNGRRMKVFFSHEAALNWLGREPGPSLSKGA